MQIPRRPLYCQNPLLADSITCKFIQPVRVTCDVGYLCANFGFPRPLCSRLRPDVHDRRQTSDRQTSDKSIA